MFDADEELALFSGDVLVERTIGEEDLRQPISVLGLRAGGDHARRARRSRLPSAR